MKSNNYYSYFKLNINNMDWIFLLICILSIVGGQYFKWLYWTIVIIPSFIIYSALYCRRKTPFEEKYNLIKKQRGIFFFTKSKFVPFLTGSHMIFFYLIIYKEGIEIRVLYTCYYIPFNKIIEVKQKKNIFGSTIIIKSNIKFIPNEIYLSDLNEDIYYLIKKNVTN